MERSGPEPTAFCLAGWPGGPRKMDRRSPPWQPLKWRSLEAWLKGHVAASLPLALAGPAGDLENAVLRRRPGCYIANRV